MDSAMAGRIGNTVTINGRRPEPFAVRAGERVRLRLINAANARIFALAFAEHRPQVIALDGQPVEPHEPADGRVVLGPAMRADVVLDMSGAPGKRFAITDSWYPRLAYTLVELAYSDAPPLREHPRDAPIRLADNPQPEPDLAAAERHAIALGGGMMGMGGGSMRGMNHAGIWTMNGTSASGHAMKPMLTLARGASCILALRNDTAWHHPMHLHGHSFRVIARNGAPTRRREWQDTVLVAPRESVEIAFVADSPGDWMFHCHVLEHQESGMMAVVRVA
jgi:FtsP/CotA-like multicopper oxidase with cupredoxin domain